jgi:hypothetical protein
VVDELDALDRNIEGRVPRAPPASPVRVHLQRLGLPRRVPAVARRPEPREARRVRRGGHLGSGGIVASGVEVPNFLENLV